MDTHCYGYGKPGGPPFCYHDDNNRPIVSCDHTKGDRLTKFYLCKQKVSNPTYTSLSESQDSENVSADVVVGCCDQKIICGRCNSLGLVCKSCWDKFNSEYNL